MAKVIKFPVVSAGKFGLRRVRRRKKNLEEYGQLNLFAKSDDAKIIDIGQLTGFFETALNVHDQSMDRASVLYKKAIEKEENVSDSYCNLGIIESHKGNLAASIDCFTKSLEKDPRHFESHFNLANLYADASNLALAILHYQVAKEIMPEDCNIYYNLALVYAIDGKYEESMASLNKYFELIGDTVTDKEAEKLLVLLQSTIGITGTQTKT